MKRLIVFLFLTCLFFLSLNIVAAEDTDPLETEAPIYADEGAWPRLNHDNSATSQTSSEATSSNEIKWKYEMPEPIDDIEPSSPTVDSKGRIYVGYGDVYCFNSDGTLRWRYKADSSVFGSPSIDAQSRIYFASEKSIYCLNSEGKLIWSEKLALWPPDIGASLAIDSKGNLYYHSSHNGYINIICLDRNGLFKWNYTEFANNDLVNPGFVITSSNNIIFTTKGLGLTRPKVYCLNPDGTLKWIFDDIPEENGILSGPAMDSKGCIYVGTVTPDPGQNALICLNPDGTLKWKYMVFGSIAQTPSIDSEGNIIFGIRETDPSKSLYFLYSISPEGTLNWKYSTKAAILSSAAIDANDNIYFTSADGYLYALNSRGNFLWKVYVGFTSRNNPAIGPDGTIYIANMDGVLIAIGKKKPSPTPVNGKTVPMQKTGLPLNIIALAVLMIASGIISSKK